MSGDASLTQSGGGWLLVEAQEVSPEDLAWGCGKQRAY